MMGFCDNLKTASGAAYFLVMVFAMSTWVDIVGIWVEMPLMVSVLPEKWSLPAYLTIIIQCANIGPALYTTVNKIRSTSSAHRSISDGRVIQYDIILTFCIITVGSLATFLMSFFWSTTAEILGVVRSIPFMILVFFSALVSCMSSVVFLPYMARFKPVYISAYYIGQGLCGLVPGMVGLVQGVGRQPDCVSINQTIYNKTTEINETVVVITPVYPPPLFGVNVFMLFLTAILCMSGVAYFCLNYTSVGKNEMIKSTASFVAPTDAKDKDDTPASSDSHEGELYVLLNNSNENRIGSSASNNDVKLEPAPVAVESVVVIDKKPIATYRFIVLLVMVGIVNSMTNGILPATQSYTCLPFGSMAYTLSIRLSSVAGPLAALSSMFLPRPSLRVVGGLTLSATAIASFHLLLAVQSPNPILKGMVIGEIIVIISSVVMSTFFSFIRVSVASILREEGGRRELLWCGGITQLGSFCGAIITFILVSILHVFKSEKPCQVL